jgi:hypothetical protein
VAESHRLQVDLLRDLDLSLGWMCSGSRAAGVSVAELTGTTVVILTSVGTSVGIVLSVQFEPNEVGDGVPVGTGISTFTSIRKRAP